MALLSLPLTALAIDTGFRLSQYTFGVYTNTPNTFVEPTLILPDNYKGTPSYKSDKTDIATVDATTGKVTYVGKGKGYDNRFLKKKLTYNLCGPVKITITLPANGTYKADSLSYIIYYCNYKKTIKSEDDWVALGKDAWEYEEGYNDRGKFYYAYHLHTYLVDIQTDLNFTNKNKKKDIGGISFYGYMDGNGHTFNLDYEANMQTKGPMKELHGIVKNVKLAGTSLHYRSITGIDKCPGLFSQPYNGKSGTASPDLTSENHRVIVENCVCEVKFKESGTALFGLNNVQMGGFVNEVYGEVTFRDCVFAGEIDYDNLNLFGGFVAHNIGKVNFINCVSDFSKTSPKKVGKYVGYFCGRSWEKNSVTISNSYFRKPASLPKGSSISDDGTTIVTKEEIKLGRIPYYLKAGRTGDENPWVLNVGTDTIPQLKLFSPKAKEVFHSDNVMFSTVQDGYTTVFSPFDFNVTEASTKYVVTGIDETEKTVKIAPLNSSATASTPIILYSTDKLDYATSANYYNKVDNNLGYLRGVYETTKPEGNYYTLVKETSDNGTTTWKFKKSSNEIAAYSCYLAGGNEDEYTLNVAENAEEVCVISSKADWTTFKTQYSAKTVTAYLSADLTLGEEDAMENFTGVLYGQGHTITLASTTPAFTKFGGLMIDVKVNGTVNNACLISEASSNPYITDCCITGAAVCSSGSPIYTSCLIVNGDDMVAYYSNSKTAMTITDEQVNNGKFAYKFKAGRTGDDDARTITADQLKSGEFAYKLNAGRTGDDAVWVQTIGTDSLPTLRSTSPESKEVFHAEATTREATSDKWSTLFYPADVDLTSATDLCIYDDFGLTGDSLYCYENLSGKLYAGTPALLYSPNGLPAITLPEVYYNKVEPTADLVGVYDNTDASTLYTLTIQNDSAYFKTSAETLPAWQCYTTIASKAVDNGTVITSKNDWNKFKTRYSGRSTNARLVCDLELTASDEPMQNFAGTFNGTMATITLDGASAPFKNATGLIKQLTVKGTPASGSAAIVSVASGDLTLQDCYSSAGALLGDATSDAKASKAATNAIVYNNCLTIVGNDTLAYVGDSAKAMKVTTAQVKSGELAYKLNNGRTGYSTMWLQTIGTDLEPTLTSITAEEVFEAIDTIQIPTTGWATHYYPVAIEKPEGVKVFTVTGVTVSSGDSDKSDAPTYVLQLKEIADSIPAYTPVLLTTLNEVAANAEATEPKTIIMPTLYYNTLDSMRVDETTTAKYVLFGSEADMESFNNCYLLQNDTLSNSTVIPVFRLAEADEKGNWPTIAQWSSLLYYVGTEESSDPETSSVYLTKDGAATGINPALALNALLSDGKIYDLSGRQITGGQLQKGQVYIKNGQKFVVN